VENFEDQKSKEYFRGLKSNVGIFRGVWIIKSQVFFFSG